MFLKSITRVVVKPLKLSDQTMFRVDNFQSWFLLTPLIYYVRLYFKSYIYVSDLPVILAL